MSHIVYPLIQYLKVYEWDKKKRYGTIGDGGYVVGKVPRSQGDQKPCYDGYISAGVSREESFTRDFLADHSIPEGHSFAFDGTIDQYPYEYTTEVAFIKKNISNENSPLTTNLHSILDTHKSVFIKMDIEGGEYPWIESLSLNQLNSIRQMVIEFHGVGDDEWGTSFYEKVKCLQKLSSTHCLIHAHGNNCSSLIPNSLIPNVLELTWIHRDLHYNFKLNTDPLPIANIDFPNNPRQPEMDLNFYPFVSSAGVFDKETKTKDLETKKEKLQDWIPLEKIDWKWLSGNPNAISLLEQHPEKIDWMELSCNPNAIPLLEQHPEKIDWWSLSKNPNAIPLLEKHPEKINWKRLSLNPNAIPLLEQHPEKINWKWLSGNPNAISLLEQHPEKIDWMELSQNPAIFEFK